MASRCRLAGAHLEDTPCTVYPRYVAAAIKLLVTTLLLTLINRFALFLIEPRPPLTDTNMDKNPESKEAQQESFLLLRRNSIQKLFNGYEYDIEQ